MYVLCSHKFPITPEAADQERFLTEFRHGLDLLQMWGY
jgi:hypothetical protein